MSVKSVLVLPDIHYPREDVRTMRAVEKYMQSQEWDKVIYLGDVMDLNVISSHNARNLRAVAGETLQKDYDYVNKVLDRHVKLLGKAEIIYLEGNHEYRVTRYIDALPQLEGIVEVPKCLYLKDRGIKWVPSWSKGTVYTVGKANFIHGLYTGDAHAKSHVQKFGCNIFYGHLHDLQLYSWTRMGDNSTIVGHSLGCLCDYKAFWMKGRPNRWQQAVTRFDFFPDGHFTYNVIPIFKHRFVANGVVYQG